MIIINKKRIQIIITCFFIGFFAFFFQIADQSKNTKKNSNIEQQQKNAVTTTATPVSGKIIVVDAGHGSPDERCRK